MVDIAALRNQLMDWFYDKANGSTSKMVSIKEFAEGAALDVHAARSLITSCQVEGLLVLPSDSHNAIGLFLTDYPSARLTLRGITDVVERRRQRFDPITRAAACRAGLLRWFFRQYSLHQFSIGIRFISGSFLEADEGFWEGARFTVAEVRAAVLYLVEKGLLREVEELIPLGPLVGGTITAEGIDCVTDWEGDVSQYLRDQRGYGSATTYNGPVIHGNAHGGQWAVNSHDVTQNQSSQVVAPGFEPLAKAVATILATLPAYGLAEERRQEVRETAEEVMTEVQQPQPEPRRIRRAVAALKGFLLPIAIEAASEEARELAQHGIDQLTSAF